MPSESERLPVHRAVDLAVVCALVDGRRHWVVEADGPRVDDPGVPAGDRPGGVAEALHEVHGRRVRADVHRRQVAVQGQVTPDEHHRVVRPYSCMEET